MINRELLKQAQEQRNEEQRKAEQARIDSFERSKLEYLQRIQIVMSKLGIEVYTDDMHYTKDSYPFVPNAPVLFQVGDMLTGYPFSVAFQSDGMYQINVDKHYIRVDRIDQYPGELPKYRAQLGDLLDAYDEQRAEALEQFKAEFPKPTEPAQDETLDDLSVQVDEAFYELNEYAMYESRELQDLIGKAGQAWRKFSKRALAAPAEPTTPRHPDFEEWYTALEEGEDVKIGKSGLQVFLRTDRFAQVGFSRLSPVKIETVKQYVTDLQHALDLAEQWNKDKEDSANDIGWNDHHEGNE